MTLAEVQALDAAYDFVPGEGTKTGAPESAYEFRGVRTGDKTPPAGFAAEDFRIPTLDEVMRAYPEIPINIEIKGTGDSDVDSFIHNAELLAAELNRIGRSEGIIVASFNDLALSRFHELAPQIGLAPATGAVAAWKAANAPLPEGTVAFQVPITFGGVGVTDAEFVQRAHAQGYAVHVWLSGQREAPDVYEQLLDWNVDGVMAAEPTSLERVLCMRDVVRPVIPGVDALPGRGGGGLRRQARGALAGWARAGASGCASAARAGAAAAPARCACGAGRHGDGCGAWPRRRFAIADGRRARRVRLRLTRRGRTCAQRAAAAMRGERAASAPERGETIGGDFLSPPAPLEHALEEVADRAREPCALPGQRRVALVLDHELAPGQALGVLLRPGRTGGGGRPRRAWPPPASGRSKRSSSSRPSKAREPGTTRMASATACEVAVAADPLARGQLGGLAPALGQVLEAGGGHEAVDAAALEPLRQPLPGRQPLVARARRAVVGGGDLHQRAPRAPGCSSAHVIAVAAPIELPTRTGRSRASSSSTASRSRTRSAYSYSPGWGARSDSPWPRAS